MREYPEEAHSPRNTRYPPETVRKALNLLADMDIVRTVEGSGTIVLSAEKAEKYLETVSVRGGAVGSAQPAPGPAPGIYPDQQADL